MRVLYLARYDAAGQGYLLTKAMRDVLGWDAMNCVMTQTYLDYPIDWQPSSKRRPRRSRGVRTNGGLHHLPRDAAAGGRWVRVAARSGHDKELLPPHRRVDRQGEQDGDRAGTRAGLG